jgi:hypothetical protein
MLQDLRSNKRIEFADQIESMTKVVIDNDKPQDLFVHIRNLSCKPRTIYDISNKVVILILYFFYMQGARSEPQLSH